MTSILRLQSIHPNDRPSDPIYAGPYGQELLRMYKEYYPKVGFQIPWVGYVIIENETAVGTCGFTMAPVDHQVEIAYWTFPENEGKGIASWACNALVQIAEKENPNLQVVAKTAPEKNASTHILEKNGFSFQEVVQDAKIGDAWLWVRK
ncbi:MAG: GNAT family N-acetyltransferase [Crocinitomicaceae bacterium]|jgi:RimJ/RimL family protein N-acetyltransferase|nr:GNAT family N-acetyltransferase [Crocinitomicaceae bacterium]